MAKVFICYSRESEAVVKALAGDIKLLGHEAWFDQDLSGGRAWWDVILGQIRDCDLLVAGLAPAALDSVACRREIGYARDLGKPVLPVLVAEGVSIALLPAALSTIQFVDYRAQDRAAALHLARAISAVPQAQALPSPLPPPPDVPISYLGDLRQRIETAVPLGFPEQSALLLEIKRSLREPENRDDGRTLMRLFRKRPDLLATIAEEIDQLLAGTPQVSLVSSSDAAPMPSTPVADATADARPSTRGPAEPAEAGAGRGTAPRQRKLAALAGGAACAVVGLISVLPVIDQGSFWDLCVITLVPGTGGAIAGAISGARLSFAGTAIAGAILGWMAPSLWIGESDVAFRAGGVLVAPVGAILGASLVVLVRKWTR